MMMFRAIACGVAICVSFFSVTCASAQDAAAGKLGFAKNCAACHQLTGLGIKGAFPALSGSPIAQGPDETMIRLVLQGRGGMPSFKGTLQDAALADILTYVRGAWANHASAVTDTQIAAVKQSLSEADNRPKGN
jgi:cytochrome c6